MGGSVVQYYVTSFVVEEMTISMMQTGLYTRILADYRMTTEVSFWIDGSFVIHK